MNIAYVIPDLDTKGGIQNFAKDVAKVLKKNHSIQLFRYNYFPFHKYNEILFLFPAAIGVFLFKYIFSRHFKKIYNFNNFDLIHFWHIDAAMAFTDNNYIVTCHGQEILPIHIVKYRKILYREVLVKAKYITADSEYTKKLIINNFNIAKEKIIVVYPCIDTKKFNIPKIKHNGIIIGSISRFVPRKNFINIIKALNYLYDNYKMKFTYYIAGTGSDKQLILETLNKSKFEWKYLGEISESLKIHKFYPVLDIFVQPTLSLKDSIEGFGIVYIEANSAKIPVLASKVGGVIDAVNEGKTGLFCDPADYIDIADKIKELIKNKEKFDKNFNSWVSRFDISNISNRFNKLYENN